MARIFISGSSTGLGLLAGQHLVSQGHRVVLHARNATRAADARKALPAAEAIVTGDLETIAGMREAAAQVNALGGFDAVIHNAGIYEDHGRTADGLPAVFAVNVLAAYLLTALVERPRRLVYLSSSMHQHVRGNLNDLGWRKGRWSGKTGYSESKLFDTMLAFALARLWPGVLANAVDPGWVPTRMGGPNAPDDLELGCQTQAWLAAGDEPGAHVSGQLFFHQRVAAANPEARDHGLQERLLALCEEITGTAMPGA